MNQEDFESLLELSDSLNTVFDIATVKKQSFDRKDGIYRLYGYTEVTVRIYDNRNGKLLGFDNWLSAYNVEPTLEDYRNAVMRALESKE